MALPGAAPPHTLNQVQSQTFARIPPPQGYGCLHFLEELGFGGGSSSIHRIPGLHRAELGPQSGRTCGEPANQRAICEDASQRAGALGSRRGPGEGPRELRRHCPWKGDTADPLGGIPGENSREKGREAGTNWELELWALAPYPAQRVHLSTTWLNPYDTSTTWGLGTPGALLKVSQWRG